MSTFRSSLSARPVIGGFAVLLLAMVGSGVGITAALKFRDSGVAAVAVTPAPALRAPAAVSGDLADMVATVVPAVVQVQVTGLRRRTPGVISPDDSEGLPRFYDDAPRAEEDAADEVLGSGFIVDAKGLVVTNAHVVEGGSKIRVRLASGREIAAELIGVDTKTDLAVLRISGDGAALPTVSWGESDKVRVGDAIFAVGSPFGLGSTVTSGIVSGRGREIGEGPYDDFLQIDAAINQGNSGGPLFDRYGHVIGVNTAIFSPSDSGGNVGIGFAIPAHMVQQVVRQLVANGRVIRGQIGISIQPVTEDIAESMGLPKAQGALVAGVSPNSPAARGGVRIGDIITRFGDAP
ncbi:MAG: S1C family serine protease, partial [Polymorphobacter sp.]